MKTDPGLSPKLDPPTKVEGDRFWVISAFMKQLLSLKLDPPHKVYSILFLDVSTSGKETERGEKLGRLGSSAKGL